jgi:Na+/H+ antiporter NhaD/arsenite permease-like protein
MGDRKSLRHVAHEDFVAVVANDEGFQLFVADVTPEDEIQQVWLAEAIALLKLLWEIYQILKALGVFDFISKWLLTRKTKRAMRVLPFQREQAVGKVLAEARAKHVFTGQG